MRIPDYGGAQAHDEHMVRARRYGVEIARGDLLCGYLLGIIETLEQRIAALETGAQVAAVAPKVAPPTQAVTASDAWVAPPPKRRGRPRKNFLGDGTPQFARSFGP